MKKYFNFLDICEEVNKFLFEQSTEKITPQQLLEKVKTEIKTKNLAPAYSLETINSTNILNAAASDIIAAYLEDNSLLKNISALINESTLNNYNIMLISEADMKAVNTKDAKYYLEIDDNDSIKLINVNNPETKFSIKDYQKVNNWINKNKNAWIDKAKKFSLTYIDINNDKICQICNGLINTKSINNCKNLSDLVIKVKENSRHFSYFEKIFVALKNDKTIEEIEKYKISYIESVAIFLWQIKKYLTENKNVHITTTQETQNIDAKKQDTEKLEEFKTKCQELQLTNKNKFKELALACDDSNDVKMPSGVYYLWSYDWTTLIDTFNTHERLGNDDEIDSNSDADEVQAYLSKGGINDKNEIIPAHPLCIKQFLTDIFNDIVTKTHGQPNAGTLANQLITDCDTVLNAFPNQNQRPTDKPLFNTFYNNSMWKDTKNQLKADTIKKDLDSIIKEADTLLARYTVISSNDTDATKQQQNIKDQFSKLLKKNADISHQARMLQQTIENDSIKTFIQNNIINKDIRSNSAKYNKIWPGGENK